MSETVKGIFEKLASQLQEDPGRVIGVNTVLQFNITGNGGGSYHIILRDSDDPIVDNGTYAGRSDYTMTIADLDFLKLVKGQLNLQIAWMRGQLKIVGKLEEALELLRRLGIGK